VIALPTRGGRTQRLLEVRPIKAEGRSHPTVAARWTNDVQPLPVPKPLGANAQAIGLPVRRSMFRAHIIDSDEHDLPPPTRHLLHEGDGIDRVKWAVTADCSQDLWRADGIFSACYRRTS